MRCFSSGELDLDGSKIAQQVRKKNEKIYHYMDNIDLRQQISTTFSPENEC
jgi:hypothetical protein